jgi:hypothetical protein
MDLIRKAMSPKEPRVWAVLLRMREFFVPFMLLPPMWFAVMTAIGAAACWLRLLILQRKVRAARVTRQWMAARNRSWPLADSTKS